MSRGINIVFKGVEWKIPAHKAFDIGEQVEDIATLAEMAGWQARPKFFKIARCYGAMLRFAGARVSNADVHSEMMAEIKSAGGSGAVPAGLFFYQAIAQLVTILMDGMPDVIAADDAGPEAGDVTGKKPIAS